MLVGLAERAGIEFFHTPCGEAYASIPIHVHRETYALRSPGLRLWLRQRFYAATEKAPSSQAVQDALGVLEARAVFDGPEIPVFMRVAEEDGHLYLDLAEHSWRAVKVSAQGWQVVATPPVRFVRSPGMLPTAAPMPGGAIAGLRRFVNVPGDADFMMLVSFILAALRPRGPYPVLILEGEQGSAKSTTARVLRALVDPNTAPLRSEPREVRDLMIAARNGWMVALDNLSSLSVWMSDAVCRLATGGGFSTRMLYTDTSEMIFDAMRPVVLNGITNPAEHGDLLDRAIVLTAPALAESERVREDIFWMAFTEAQPALLGALLDVLTHTLATLPDLELPPLPRMADFAAWSIAATPKVGWTGEAFLAAYAENRSEAHQHVIDASLISTFLMELAEGAGWKGTSSALLQVLNTRAPEASRRLKGWPQTPRALAGLVRRVTPSLRAKGVTVEFARAEDRARTRLVMLTRNNKGSTVHTVQSSVWDADGKSSTDGADDATSLVSNVMEDENQSAVSEIAPPGHA
jgi:hypothetical protein